MQVGPDDAVPDVQGHFRVHVDVPYWTRRVRRHTQEIPTDLVVSENANGAESPNPGGVVEIRGDPPTMHGLCGRRAGAEALLQSIRYVQLARTNSSAASPVAIGEPAAKAEFWHRTGTGIKHFTGKGLAAYLFPLPPLAEQHRIVVKVDELMALCDGLEASLASGNDTRHQLLDSLLHETLSLSEEKIGQDISTITQELPDEPPGSPEALTEPTSAGASSE